MKTKFGIFSVETTGIGVRCFTFKLYAQGLYFFRTKESWRTDTAAMAAGIKRLKAYLYESVVVKPLKVRLIPKTVDAVQWFEGMDMPTVVRAVDTYYWHNTPIFPGDWIVDGSVVSDDSFKERYEIL